MYLFVLHAGSAECGIVLSVKTYKLGGPLSDSKSLPLIKDMIQRQRQALPRRGIRPQLLKRLWKGKKKAGGGIKISVARF